ncbi:hypothetical protein GCM10007354_05830 [Acinetobacter courvalinii]|uniref:Uncharacterized protein n=1 Tax=Acinetobacter courvalinii TaxID=280147 RepID=A0ABD0A3V7_9GAMM|nr:hypothetical protein GCM10007354_05830 [Acinetobacter courvalinii]
MFWIGFDEFLILKIIKNQLIILLGVNIFKARLYAEFESE